MGAGVDSGCGFVLVEAPGMRGRPALSASRAGAFADVDGDCRADLLLPNAVGELEVWAAREAPLAFAPPAARFKS